MQDAPGKDVEPPSSLLDAYDLRDTDDAKTSSSGQGTNDYKHLPREEEVALLTERIYTFITYCYAAKEISFIHTLSY